MKTRTKLIALALTTVLMTVVVSGLTVNAKKPLYCEKTLDMYPALPGELYMKGWISGGIDGYFVIYHSDPQYEKPTGQVTHHRERWEIWEDADMTVKLLSGTNTALASMRKMEWQAQGVVEWVNENGPYSDLLGNKWHSYGIFIVSPEPGAIVRLVDTSFRIN